jgi:hypothetical protein
MGHCRRGVWGEAGREVHAVGCAVQKALGRILVVRVCGMRERICERCMAGFQTGALLRIAGLRRSL